MRISADDEGLVSRAKVALPRKITISTGLGTVWSEALLREAGCGFSMGYPIKVQAAVQAVPDHAWEPAYDIEGEPRDGAWIAEITGLRNFPCSGYAENKTWLNSR